MSSGTSTGTRVNTTGWGRYPKLEATWQFPQDSRAAVAALQQATASGQACLGRGMGRSYGDSALAPALLATRQLQLMQGFDPESGRLTCGAGLTLDEILRVFVPKGWFLPVTPGTRFVSVGGAIASDVHGKNHHRDGCFSAFVESLQLLLGTGEIVTCSPTQYPELFRATCGGMGLTGFLLSATLRLLSIQSAWIDQTTYKAQNLAHALALFEQHGAAHYSVAWIDCLASGDKLGRSLLMLGEHSPQGALTPHQPGKLAIPLEMPAQLLNPLSIQAFNTLYYHRVMQPVSQQHIHYAPFFYPLDSILHWNRLYGRAGFTQYQFVLPKAAGLAGMTRILTRIADSHRGSFLAVLKAFGPANDNLLSFPMEGYTLALDFKLEDGLFALLDELDAMVLDHGGRLYLTKDCRMSANMFRQSYPQWEAFEAIRSQYGAIGKFASLQSQRLGLA